MEISYIDFDERSAEYASSEEDPRAAKVGLVCLKIFGFIGACAFIPAAFRKKRTYTSFSPLAPPQVIEFLELENPNQKPVSVCKPNEKKIVDTIFNTVAAGGLFNPLRIRNLKYELIHLHPFSFLLAIPKAEMQIILKSRYRMFVLWEIKSSLDKEKNEHNLLHYVDNFSQKMGKDPKRIKRHIQTASWDQLVDYLFDMPSLR